METKQLQIDKSTTKQYAYEKLDRELSRWCQLLFAGRIDIDNLKFMNTAKIDDYEHYIDTKLDIIQSVLQIVTRSCGLHKTFHASVYDEEVVEALHKEFFAHIAQLPPRPNTPFEGDKQQECSNCHCIEDELEGSCDFCDKVFCVDCTYNKLVTVDLGDRGDYCMSCYNKHWNIKETLE